ncbi:MAG: GAF domain-containing protein, partial [Thermoplasmata archaeon]
MAFPGRVARDPDLHRVSDRAAAEAATWEIGGLTEEHAQLLLVLDRDSLYREVAERVRRSTGMDLAYVAPLEADGRIVLRGFSTGLWGNSLRHVTVPAGRGQGGRVLASGAPVVLDDYYSAESITHDFDRQVREEGLRSCAAVPMISDARVVGVIYAGLRGRGEIGDRAVTTMRRIARSAVTAIE